MNTYIWPLVITGPQWVICTFGPNRLIDINNYHRPMDAALGNTMMGISSTVLGLTGFKAIIGLGTIGEPIVIVLGLVFIAGGIIYFLGKDTEIEEYLKTGLWSKQGSLDRQAIKQSHVNCFTHYTKNPTWQAKHVNVEKYMQIFFPISIKLFIKDNYAYVGIVVHFTDDNQVFIRFEFCNNDIDTIDLDFSNKDDGIVAIIEEQLNGFYKFEACFSLNTLFKKYPLHEYKNPAGGHNFYLGTSLEVIVTPSQSADIKYNPVKDSIVLLNFHMTFKRLHLYKAQMIKWLKSD